MRRLIPRLTAVALLIALLVLSSHVLQGWAYLRTPGPAPIGSAQVVGLRSPAEISRDAFGVPHVRAQSLPDAFRALGFAHAQDRLWQMEILRRTAHGRLSEVFGATTLAQDRLARTLGFGVGARDELQDLPRRERALIGAYAEGVNAWLARSSEDDASTSSAELRWLGIQPEPWSIEDSLAIVRLRAFLLSRSLGASLLLERLNRRLGGTEAQEFFPIQPPLYEPPPPPPQRPESPPPETMPSESSSPDPELLGSLLRIGRAADGLARAAGLRGPVGSLGFIVGRARSASGAPLLANDPHVEFQIPPRFYFAHLDTPELAVAGATWPGVPVFWMGHNRRIAWGQVALHVVVSDLFDETLHPQKPGLYQVAGRWHELDRRVEEIAVRSRAPQQIGISTTRHGPLLGSLLPEDPRIQSYSLRWTGGEPSSGIAGLLRVHQASGWKPFRSALRDVPGPPATWLYADVSGDTGTQVVGRLPLRDVPPGLLSVPGEYDWSGFVPFDDLPSRRGRSETHRVVSTRGDGSPFPSPTEWLWADGGAAARLEARLEEGGRLTIDDVLALQREQHSERGVRGVREILGDRVFESDAARRVAEILRAWDGSTQPDQVGASVYHALRQRLAGRLLAEKLGEGADAASLAQEAEPLPGVLMARFLERMQVGQRDVLIQEALAETWTWLGIHVSANPKRWTWGDVHRLRLTHALEQFGSTPLAWAGRALGRGPFPAPGDPDSVWTMYHRSLPSPALVGPAARYAVDLGDLDHAQFGLAGGQSGHPGSPHYDDGLEPWLRGQARPLWMHRLDVKYHEAGRWVLEPEGKPGSGEEGEPDPG